MMVRILLLDDDNRVRLPIEKVLRERGYTVDGAATAADARHRLKEATYDLVIADARLPDGDGNTIADEGAVRGAKPLILTGYPVETTRHDVLFKPIRPEESVWAVQMYVGVPSDEVRALRGRAGPGKDEP